MTPARPFLLLFHINSVSDGTNSPRCETDQDIVLKQRQYSYNVSMDLLPDT